MRNPGFPVVVLALLLLGWSASAETYEIKVVNTGGDELTSYPVILRLSNFPKALLPADIGITGAGGTSLASQIEDLKGDGTPESIAFLIDLPAGRAKTVLLEARTPQGGKACPISGEALAWKLWSEPHLENRYLRWKFPPSRPRGVRSLSFPPDTPMPYSACRRFQVVDRKHKTTLMEFTLASEPATVVENRRQRVVSGPVRSVIRRTSDVTLQSDMPVRFRIEEQFCLYKRTRRLDISIGITNTGHSEQKVPSTLRILDGRMGELLVKDLGEVRKRRERNSRLWLNTCTGFALAYIPHGPAGTGWSKETFGVDYFRFAPSPGSKLRLSGVETLLAPGETKRFTFTFRIYSGKAEEIERKFKREADSIPGVVSVYGPSGEVKQIAEAPRFIVDGVSNVDRWIASSGANIEKAGKGAVITVSERGQRISTPFTRDFSQRTVLEGAVVAPKGTALKVDIEEAENGEIHNLGTVRGAFSLDLNKALPFEEVTKCLLHLRPVSSKGGKGKPGQRQSVNVKQLNLTWPMPEAPRLPWPKDGQHLSDVGVSFSIQSTGGAERGYELQLAGDRLFKKVLTEERFKPDTRLKGERGLTKYLLASPLPKGSYFWRVRPLNLSGEPGPWSDVKTFVVDSAGGEKRPPVRPISPKNPVLFGGLKGPESLRSFAKEVRRKYPVVADLIVVQEDYAPGADYPLPIFANCSSKPTLPLLEHAYRNEPQVVGMVFREFGFDKEYLKRVLALSAKYGRYVSALNLGKDMGLRTYLTEEFYPVMEEYSAYMLPQRKMNNRRDQLAQLLCEIGSYVSGRVGQWGIESEWGYAWKTMGWKRWSRTEAINRPLNYMPVFVFGLSTGASLYRLEGLAKRQIPYPFDRNLPEKFGPLWKRAIAPFFQDIVKYDMIPAREQMLEKIAVAIEGKELYGLKRPGSPGTFFPSRVVAALHGLPIEGVPVQHIFENQWIPDSSAFYVVPVLPPYMPPQQKRRFEKIIDAEKFDYPEDAREYAARFYPPQKSEAFSVLVGDTGVVLNSIDERRNPLSGPQQFRLDLDRGPVSCVSGKVDFQAYLLMKQMEGSLFIHSNNFQVNYTEIRLKSRNGRRLEARVTPSAAVRSIAWEAGNGVLNLRLNHYHGVARVTVETAQR